MYVTYLASLEVILYKSLENLYCLWGLDDDVSLLEKYDFIDVLMHAEGEEPFTMFLKTLVGLGDISSVPDISYRRYHGTQAWEQSAY